MDASLSTCHWGSFLLKMKVYSALLNLPLNCQLWWHSYFMVRNKQSLAETCKEKLKKGESVISIIWQKMYLYLSCLSIIWSGNVLHKTHFSLGAKLKLEDLWRGIARLKYGQGKPTVNLEKLDAESQSIWYVCLKCTFSVHVYVQFVPLKRLRTLGFSFCFCVFI